jgi:hypothetical protein
MPSDDVLRNEKLIKYNNFKMHNFGSKWRHFELLYLIYCSGIDGRIRRTTESPAGGIVIPYLFLIPDRNFMLRKRRVSTGRLHVFVKILAVSRKKQLNLHFKNS